MTEQAISVINASGEKLTGLEAHPANKAKKYPAIILVHGFGVDKSEFGMFDELAKLFPEKGFAVFRFDFSGCGQSEGDYLQTSLTKLKADLSSILKYVSSQQFVDKKKIGILAHSLGTTTTVVLEPLIACLVLTSSVSTPKESLKALFGGGYNPEGLSTRINSASNKTTIGPQFWKDFDKHDAIASIRRMHCPILFVSGGSDNKVPLSEMEALFAAANPPKQKIILEGANHQLNPKRHEFYDLALEWFRKYLLD